MSLPAYLPLIKKGWRISISGQERAVNTAPPIPFKETVELLHEKHPGWFIEAELATTDPLTTFTGKIDGVTVIQGDMRGAKWMNLTSGTVMIHAYNRYILTGFDVPIYMLRLSSTQPMPINREIIIAAHSLTPNSLILGFASLVIVIDDEEAFMEELKRLGLAKPEGFNARN